MKTVFEKSAGFTIIELMAVVAIISVLATVVASSAKAGKASARMAKCQANMHSLHQASLAYMSDFGKYPAATAFEWSEMELDGKTHYYETRGWVNWANKNGKDCRRRGDGAVYQYSEDSRYGHGGTQSKASQFCYAGSGAGDDEARVKHTIEEGAIFKYTGKNASVFCCPDFKFGDRKLNDRHCKRSYAMNAVFGSRRYRNNIVRLNGVESVAGVLDSAYPKSNHKPHVVSASRLAMFVEFEPDKGSYVGGAGGTASGDTKFFSDDSEWHFENNVMKLGFLHKGMTNVIFADGHAETFLDGEKAKNKKNKGSKLTKADLESIFKGDDGEE